MSRHSYHFAIWCLLVFAGSALAAYYAWSPFSDEDSRHMVGVRGPTHK